MKTNKKTIHTLLPYQQEDYRFRSQTADLMLNRTLVPPRALNCRLYLTTTRVRHDTR